MPVPQLAVIVSTFQRPLHLQRVLVSIACQRGFEMPYEIVVTDDGSADETVDVVDSFAQSVTIPVSMTTHSHAGFRLARCRNEGAATSVAPYLLFLDGDCLIPPDHLRHHFARRRMGHAMAGYCCLLGEAESEQVTINSVRSGDFIKFASRAERQKLRRMDRRARWYRWLNHPTKPKLYGGNVGIFRCDYERVNGYDENFVGWGCEDDDLRLRLRAAGTRIQSILRWTHTYHLWHPKSETTPDRWREGANVPYLVRSDRMTVCANGLSNVARNRDSFTVHRWNDRRVA